MFMSCQNSRKHDHRAQINQFPVLSCGTHMVFFYLSVGLSMFQCHSKDHLTGSVNNSLTFHGISWHPLATTVRLFNQIPSFNHLWKRNSPLCDPPFFHFFPFTSSKCICGPSSRSPFLQSHHSHSFQASVLSQSLLIAILVPLPKSNSPHHYLQIGR